jgi:hypothetical protein
MIPRNAPDAFLIHGESHAISGIAGRLPSATARETRRATGFAVRRRARRRIRRRRRRRRAHTGGAERALSVEPRLRRRERRKAGRHERLRAVLPPAQLLEGLLLGERAHEVRDGDDGRVKNPRAAHAAEFLVAGDARPPGYEPGRRREKKLGLDANVDFSSGRLKGLFSD